MTRSILERPVNRGKLWGAPHTWAQAIQNHAELCHAGCCRFFVTDEGIWLEGVGGRQTTYRTKLPKGAEDFARTRISAERLIQSARDPRLWDGPAYA